MLRTAPPALLFLLLTLALLVACSSSSEDNEDQDTTVEDTRDLSGDNDMQDTGDPDTSDSDTAEDTADDTEEDGDVQADTTEPAPLISEVFGDCTQPGSIGGLAGGTALGRVDLNLDDYPEATCSDGTPGLFYVQAGSESDKWLIMLQGGGACTDPEGCVERWCSADGKFGANKLTNRFAPERGMQDDGILADRQDNVFQNFNKVFIYYCTSDLWTGTQGMTEYESPHPIDGGEPLPFRISHRGTQVINGTLGTLRSGNLSYTDPGSMEIVQMPDLDDASEVVFAGSSAGGNGVAFHADRVGDLLVDSNPDLRYWALIDSAFGLDTTQLDLSTSLLCTEMELCSWQELWTWLFNETRIDYWAGNLDDTCRSWHQANDPDSEILCADDIHVIQHHISTPYVLRMGLRDNNIGTGTASRGFTVPSRGGAEVDMDLFAELLSEQIADLETIAADAEESNNIDSAPALFAPPCPKHEVLSSTPDIYNVTIEVTPGNSVNFMDIIARFRSGMPSSAIFEPGGQQSFTCP